MANKVEELVYSKYFNGIISFKGLQRIETYPIPRAAFREAVLNAIVHCNYATGNPIHIHIYLDKVLIHNDGRLPENWTADNLFAPHTYTPHNPLIADVFFCSGQIEAWGRGIEKITEAYRTWGKQEPFYRVRSNEVMIGFNTDVSIVDNIGVNNMPAKIIEIMRDHPKISATAIATKIGIAPRNVQVYIKTLKTMGLVERVGAANGEHWVVKQ